MKRRLISSSFYRALETIWATLTMLIVTPIVIKALGAEDYGLWLLILSLLSLFNFLDLGLAVAIQRKMAQYIEKNDIAKLNSIFSSSFTIFLLLSILSFGFILVVALNPIFLGISISNKATVFDALILLSIKFAFDLLSNCFHGIFSGHLRFDIDSIVSIFAMTIKSLLIMLFISDFGLLSLVIITLIVDVTVHIFKFIIVFRIQPRLKLSLPINIKQDFFDLWSYAKHVVLIELSRLIQDKSTPLLISHLFSLFTISIFSIADRLVRQAFSFIHTITGVLQPFLIRKLERDELDSSILHSSMLIHAWLSCSILLPVMLCGPAFIYLWVGTDFSESAQLIYLFVLIFLLKVLAIPISQFLLAFAKHKFLIPVEVLSSIIYICFIVLLGLNFGLVGVLWSGVITSALMHTFGYVFLAQRLLNIKISICIKVTLKMQFIFWSLYFLNQYFEIYSNSMSWLEFITSIASSFLFCNILGFYFILNKEVRGFFISLLKKKIFN